MRRHPAPEQHGQDYIVSESFEVQAAVTFTAKITSPTVIPTSPVTFASGYSYLGTAQLSVAGR